MIADRKSIVVGQDARQPPIEEYQDRQNNDEKMILTTDNVWSSEKGDDGRLERNHDLSRPILMG